MIRLSKKEEDCPQQLIKLAKTEWEKAVVVEFVEIESKIKEEFAKLKNEIKWCKYLILAVFAAIVIQRLI